MRNVKMALLLCCLVTSALAADKHVVIVIMDGLRPDSVTEQEMPTLFAMSKQGTFFDAHHPVFSSATQVNGTALATGMRPAGSNVIANREYRPDVELLQPVDLQDQWASWKVDEGDRKWLTAATLPELVRAAGMKSAVVGTKGVALLWDRSLKNRTVDSPTVFEGRSIPGAVLDPVLPEFGPLPLSVHPKYNANRAQDHWTARVLTDKVWANELPALSVLWVSEPDFAQHGSGPGSANSKTALKSSDDVLARVLAKLDEKKMRDKTNVMVVSDHGFSTIIGNVDVADELREANFLAGEAFIRKPEKGYVMVVGLGGSFSLYVIGQDKAVTARLLDFLQTRDWAGVIFTKDGAPGTFKLSDVGVDSPDAPDIMVSMKWDDRKAIERLPGTLITEGTYRGPGQGNHGSLSRFEMRNTLIAAGPDFRKGYVNKIPSGNIDITPTVLSILGIKPNIAFDGRVLEEALAGGDESKVKAETNVMETSREMGAKTWRQYLKVSRVGKAVYYDEGNAGRLRSENV